MEAASSRPRLSTLAAAAAVSATLAIGVFVIFSAGSDEEDSDDGVRPVGGDLELTMGAGGEPARMKNGLGAMVERGTVEVVAWVETELGRVEVAAFEGRTEAGAPNSLCVAVRDPEGTSSGCQEPPTAPFDRIGIRGRSFACEYATAGAYGGSGAAEAVFTTTSGRTVSVLTIRGLAYGIWSSAWGPARTVTFFDAEGDVRSTADFPQGAAETLPHPPCG